ncbi:MULTISPECIES: hypothetical protein [unclassified Streptomyces]|uniref:hypothetical protein n=1 Tax=unclassified Streptomyces TaxID=2593676 RepID=UPI0003A49ADE
MAARPRRRAETRKNTPKELVLAYLGEADQGMRAQITGALSPDASPEDDVRAVARAIADGIRSPGFRGCAFLNAVAEYPDPDHPVHRAVLAHREWFLETVTELLGRAGLEPADAAGRHFVMLRDGAMAAGCLFDPELVCETFLNGVESLLTAGAVTSRA